MNHQPIRIERCPYLGLQDDPDTALAYPSCWNCCFHAEPPASVQVAHQVKVCLTINYSNCAIILSNKWRRLPRKLREKLPQVGQGSGLSNSLPWLVFLIIVVVLFFLVFFPSLNPFF